MSRNRQNEAISAGGGGVGGYLGLLVAACLAALSLSVLAATAGAAVPPPLIQTPEDGVAGSGAGRIETPEGIAADSHLPGHVYVVDRNNARIDEFTAWGAFVRAWGWGVDKEHPEAKLQTCTEASGCQAGLEGSGPGQFKAPEAIAVDGEGDVYVIDAENHRVQKFKPGPEGGDAEFVLMFGLDVNQTKVGEAAPEAQRNLCVAGSGDVCQAGSAGSGPGRLGAAHFAYLSRLAASPTSNAVFVGEGERIQVFDSDGSFKEAIEAGDLAGRKVGALATDGAGDLYAAFVGEAEVHELAPEGPTAKFGQVEFAPESEAESPSALAVDAAGDLYVVIGGASGGEPRRVQEYDSSGSCLTCGNDGEGGKSGFDRSPEFQIEGVAASGACGENDVYLVHFSPVKQPPWSFVRAFGAPPDTDLCPLPAGLGAPQIKAQYARSVDSASAEVAANINPKFWSDTAYHLEYGKAPCQSGGCTSQTAPRNLTSQVVDAALPTPVVLLDGLEPGTTYHYRFVAQSGGGSAWGVDPDGPEGPEEASFEAGLEGTFVTYRVAGEPLSCPGNEPFRGGASAPLPDCRAYEMVSPLDKEGGGISVLGSSPTLLPAVLSQAATSGERLAYGSYRSFGGAQSAGWTTQYIARRQEGIGWQSHPISPPRGKALLAVLEQTQAEFQAFSPDLCQGWMQSVAEPPLAAGAPAGSIDLYRRSDEECGGPGYAALNTTAPATKGLNLELQGVSSDGATAIFLANKVLAPGGSTATTQLYGAEGGKEKFLCVLPGGAAFAKSCTAGAGMSANVYFDSQENQLANALSADGRRVYWTAAGVGPGKIYLRENPLAEQSAFALGSAEGTGKLTAGSNTVTSLVAAKGKASLTKEPPTATLSETSIGKFVVGQPISGSGLSAGTTIASISGQALTLSQEPSEEKSGVTVTSNGPMPFVVGQSIAAPGIPPGTKITASAPGSLTLSREASVTKANTPLEALSQCSEPAKACTLDVSGAAEEEAEAKGSQFWAASEDGSKAIFTSGGPAESGLYEYRLAGESTHPIAGGVLGVMGASEDASRVYFASREALGGPNGEGASPVEGEANLYLYEAGEPASFRFIGVLASRDLFTPSPVQGNLQYDVARVSPDGQSAAFSAYARLTGYDNTDRSSGEADAELFVYRARGNGGKGQLVCASCNPSGARPAGQQFNITVTKTDGPWTAARIPVPENVLYASRVLSSNGRRLFFDSYDSLTPRDANGRQDVYQWETPGEGRCEESSSTYSPQNGGCIDLISSGKSEADSEFLDAGPSGSDVFIATLSSLVPQDYGLVDAYDARIDGGLPPPPPAPVGCEGEACQPAPQAPSDRTPASAAFSGAGNVKAAPARKRHKKHGRHSNKKHAAQTKQRNRAKHGRGGR